jgi:hypothetical protein
MPQSCRNTAIQPSTTSSASAYGQNNQNPVHNRDWGYGVENGKGNLFALQSPEDHFQYSQILAALLAGQFYFFHFYLPENPLPGKFSNALEICLDDNNGWVLTFDKDKRLIGKSIKLNGEYQIHLDPSSLVFHPNSWNQVKVSVLGRKALCQINGIDFGKLIEFGSEKTIHLKVRSVGLSITFGGVSV